MIKAALIQKFGTLTGLAGVYIWTNLVTGDQYVGSAGDMYVRVIGYLQDSSYLKSSRKVNVNMRTYTLGEFRLDMYVVDGTGVSEKKLYSLYIGLEQYFIFTKNATLNHMLVAGANPPGFNAKPVWMIHNGKVIYKAPSIQELIRQIGISQETIDKGLANPNRKSFKGTISFTAPQPDLQVELWSPDTLIDFISNKRPSPSSSR